MVGSVELGRTIDDDYVLTTTFGTVRRRFLRRSMCWTVIGQCQPRHRHQEFLKFLERLETTIDRKRQKIPLACLRFRKAKNFFPQHNR